MGFIHASAHIVELNIWWIGGRALNHSLMTSPGSLSPKDETPVHLALLPAFSTFP
jgi:hypothetical protein